MRHTRSAMLQVLSADYVRTGSRQGPRRDACRAASRSAQRADPGRDARRRSISARCCPGAVLTEQVFTIPGFGKLIVDAVFNRDYAVVQGVVMCTAFAYFLLNLVADIAYVVLNPRLRA